MRSLVVGFIAVASLLPLVPYARGDELYVNLFRNPSIGIEYKVRLLSTHAGYYPTIISKDARGESETTPFVRVGASIWPTSWSYGSVSYLRGLGGKWRGRNEVLYEVGLQGLILRDRVALRLGVAVMPSFLGTKVNPTPGIGIRFPI